MGGCMPAPAGLGEVWPEVERCLALSQGAHWRENAQLGVITLAVLAAILLVILPALVAMARR